jgi:DNA-binding NarL/FixJ family response regulator
MSGKDKDETGKACKRITVLLSEEASIFRAALRAMLEQIDGVSVVGTVRVDDVTETARKLEPDVVLLSVTDPQPRHALIVKTLASQADPPAVVLLSRDRHPDSLREFFRAGGAARILDKASVAEMATAIRRAAAGRKYIDPEISDEVVAGLVGEPGRARAGALSRREEEVLRLMAHGYAHKEIAQKLGITPATVETYRARIAEKLDLHGRPEFIRYALRRGLLRAHDHEPDA